MSPDGNLIAFTRLRSGEQEHPEIAGSGPLRDVYVMRLSDRAVTKIVSSFNANAIASGYSAVRRALTLPPIFRTTVHQIA
jgi:Tol biopolymer transport system component